jgi:hypothetical protein
VYYCNAIKNGKNKKNFVFREGMLKMKDVYAQNPALGDPNRLATKTTHKSLLHEC